MPEPYRIPGDALELTRYQLDKAHTLLDEYQARIAELERSRTAVEAEWHGDLKAKIQECKDAYTRGDALANDLAAAHARIKELEQKNTYLEERIAFWEKRVTEAEEEAATLQSENKKLCDQWPSGDERAAQLEVKLQALETDRDNWRAKAGG